MTEFPTIPKELLDELDKRFPEKCPELRDSDREIWLYAGKRSIVTFLKKQYEIQNENILENKTI